MILGLINPGAIFVKDKDHVYFAEMDTYQIEGYPILSYYYRYPAKKICNSCLGQPSDTHFECRTCHRTYYYDFSTLFKYERLVEQRNFSMPTHCPYCRMDKEQCKGLCGKMVPSYRLNKDGLCPDCAKVLRNRIVKRYPCCDCGKMIELTQGQVDSFNEKSYSLPKRRPIKQSQ